MQTITSKVWTFIINTALPTSKNYRKHDNGIAFNIKILLYLYFLTHFTVPNSEIKEKYTDIL